jgi:hypothetical protein
MLINELRQIKSGRKQRHEFGLVIAGALLAFGAFLAWHKGFHPALFIAAAIVAAPVLLDKLLNTDTAIILLPLQKLWMGIAVIMGFIMSRIILGILFFGIFTTIRAINGITGKPLLDTAWKDPARTSYWIPRKPDEYTPEHSERQF